MAQVPEHESDTPPEAGKRPPFAQSVDPGAGKDIGTDQTYSGQEYDSAGQAEWRAEQARHALPANGEVIGSGSGAGGGNPSEDYDSDPQAGDGYARTGAEGEEQIVEAEKPT